MRKFFEVPARVILYGLLILFVGVQSLDILTHPVPTEAIAARTVPSVVLIQCKDEYDNNTWTTAGFVASKYGHILTVAHGLEGCEGRDDKHLSVFFWGNDKEFKAHLLKEDKEKDLAILQVPTVPENISYLSIETAPPYLGSKVVAVGHGNLLPWSVTQSVISGNRIQKNPHWHVLQVYSLVTFGNSGGPVVDERSRVIGMAQSISLINQNQGFLIPGKEIQDFFNDNKIYH